MAGKTPFFVTGSNCKIKVNGVTLAYATDLTYNVTINHIPAKVCGLYEADSLEPLSYSINGSFTVIRYLDSMTKVIKAVGGNPVNGASEDGNGIGSFTPSRSGKFKDSLKRTVGNLSGDGRTNEALDPSSLSRSTVFDIEVYQKIPRGSGKGISSTNRMADILQGRSTNLTTNEGGGNDFLGISRIRDCKITGVATSITKKGFMMQTFSFIANYLDEDSFVSSSSGVGQQFS